MPKYIIPARTEKLIREFIKESNEIEGIYTQPSDSQVEIVNEFIRSTTVGVDDLALLAKVFETGDCRLRSTKGLDVRVGKPPGGPIIATRLDDIIQIKDPFNLYVSYETLHPFMDCNGRTGRLLWARAMFMQEGEEFMRKGLKLGFLKGFHYQALENSQCS